ncbi:MAG TPA: MerR family transcriptional regulator [Alkalispirochaeta sp.]|nr:MerR family transcriptional regulator [Alkalispirochaeta sp.]
MHQRTYEAREVLRILGVKPHVLRYWEQSLPLIRPRRNESGYRVWNGSQLRMLLRIRHLVVERGMSVAAAGHEILHEAQPGTADTKARLEALRSRLITLLLYNRAAGDRERSAAIRRNTGTGHEASSGQSSNHAVSSFSFPLAGEAITVTPLIPSRRERPTPRDSWGPRDDRTFREREVLPNAGGGETSGVVYVPISHLFVTTAPLETARTLRSIIHERTEPTAERPVIIPVPTGALAEYQAVFHEEADHTGGGCRLLPVFPVTSGSARWWSPRMSILIALATDASLEQWLDSRRVTAAYLWAPEDPSLPAVLSEEWKQAAADHQYGIALAVQSRGSGVRLPDATVLHLPTWRPALTDTLAVGRWRMGRAHPEELAVESRVHLDGRWNGEWRFDVWQRDVLELSPSEITIAPSSAPVPWYGPSWTAEISRIWPNLERTP